MFLSLSTPTPPPHSRTVPWAGSGQPSLFPSSLGMMTARAAYRVTITKLGCQWHPRPGLETPPQMKGGTSGPSRRLYSAVIDVSQTSVTLSGGTQSTPMLGPGSLFMSPPFIWQSKVDEPPGRPSQSWGQDKGGRCAQRPPGGPLPPGVRYANPAPVQTPPAYRWAAAASLAGAALGIQRVPAHPEEKRPWLARSERMGPSGL